MILQVDGRYIRLRYGHVDGKEFSEIFPEVGELLRYIVESSGFRYQARHSTMNEVFHEVLFEFFPELNGNRRLELSEYQRSDEKLHN